MRILKIALMATVGLGVLWLAVNLWPREIPAELWTDVKTEAEGAPLSLIRQWNDESAQDREAIEAQAGRGEWESAYARWGDRFRSDVAWLNTADGVLNHTAAMMTVKEDLKLLQGLVGQRRPPEGERVPLRLLLFHPDSYNLRKALVFEYRSSLENLNGILGQRSGFQKILLNPALSRRELNDYYQGYERFLEDPNAKPPRLGYDRPFWWFVNPGGKALVSLVSLDYSEQIKKFQSSRAELIQLRTTILPQLLDR